MKTLRARGKTTALALETIADAIRNAGVWRLVPMDHAGKVGDDFLFVQLKRTIKALGLDGFEIDKKLHRIRSNHFGMVVYTVTGATRPATKEDQNGF